MCSNLRHPMKAIEPMDVTLAGILMAVSLVQPMKAEFPISFTVDGIKVPLHPIMSRLVALTITALQLSRES